MSKPHAWTAPCGWGIAVLVAIGSSGCATAHQPSGDRPGSAVANRQKSGGSEPRGELATQPASRAVLRPGETAQLFDGQTLAGWRVLAAGAFERHGQVWVKDGTIVLERGSLQTGIGWQGETPRNDYEVALEAMRLDGNDFFCGLTFPVGDESCTLIIGGWGGSVVGLSNVDNQSAAENMTSRGMGFDTNRWYAIRLRVTAARIEAWIDDEQVIKLDRAQHEFSVWWEQEPARPLGVATWNTGAALKNISLRRLPAVGLGP